MDPTTALIIGIMLATILGLEVANYLELRQLNNWCEKHDRKECKRGQARV